MLLIVLDFFVVVFFFFFYFVIAVILQGLFFLQFIARNNQLMEIYRFDSL